MALLIDSRMLVESLVNVNCNSFSNIHFNLFKTYEINVKISIENTFYENCQEIFVTPNEPKSTSIYCVKIVDSVGIMQNKYK